MNNLDYIKYKLKQMIKNIYYITAIPSIISLFKEIDRICYDSGHIVSSRGWYFLSKDKTFINKNTINRE